MLGELLILALVCGVLGLLAWIVERPLRVTRAWEWPSEKDFWR